MNSNCVVLSVCLSLTWAACNTSKQEAEVKPKINPIDSLTVGMTYDEVERWLGKPKEIKRGFTKVEAEEPSAYNSSLAELEAQLAVHEAILAELKTGTQRTIFPGPLSVATSGQLVYVTWAYDSVAIDTAYQIKPKYRLKGNYTYDFRVNGHPIGPSQRDLVDDTLFMETWHTPMIVSRERYYQRRLEDPTRLLPPVKAVFETLRVELEPDRILNGTTDQLWYVMQQFHVLFDASSGRVVQWGMLPIECRQQPLQATPGAGAR